MTRRKTATGAAVLWVCLLHGAVAGADPIDDFVTARLAADKAPGLALLVMQEGEIQKQQGYGYANLELRVPVTPETLFQSGSTGKMFAAAAILMLAEDGKLSLDDRLARYFPDAPAAWQRISIRELLTHTSGIRDYTDRPGDIDYRKDYSDDELLALMQKLPLEFEPGTRWSYSNSGYLILGLLITKLTGHDYSEFLAQRLFKPLNMPTAQLISERRITANRAAGYELDEHGEVVNQEWVAPGLNRTADGALYFSLLDLAAWERGLQAHAFMRAQSFADWWSAVRLNDGFRYPYGFGWSLAEQRGQPVLLHGGAWQGFRAAIVRYPQQHLAVMVLANAAQLDAVDVARSVAGLIDYELARRAATAAAARGDETQAATLRRVLEAWCSLRSIPAMAPSLAATAAGTPNEAHSRQYLAGELQRAPALRILGSDRLTKSAVELLADGTVSAVDTVLAGAKGPLPIRFHLDTKGRVVDFAAPDSE